MLEALRQLLADRVELLEPLPLGAPLPEVDAVLFPQLLGEAYRRVDDFRAIEVPILIVTTEFGTLSMWDWEIAEYLKSQHVQTIAPYNLEQTEKVCAALSVKRELQQTKYLVYQDDPGQGFQAPIFKRFYWWEDECSQRLGRQEELSRNGNSRQGDLGCRGRSSLERLECADRRAVRSSFSKRRKIVLGRKTRPGRRSDDTGCRNQLPERIPFLRYHALPGMESTLSGARLDLGL